MEKNVIAMSCILKNQYKTQYELLKTEQKKTDILIKGNVEELNSIMNTEQALLMNAGNLEKQRETLCEFLEIKQFSLREFAEQYDPDNAIGLKTVLNELTEVMLNLKKVGVLNNKLLTTRSQTIQYVLSSLTDKTDIDEASLTYKKL